MKPRIVFLGTPDFAAPSLDILVENGYEVSACITQPDRKAGRGHRLTPPPAKVAAERYGIPVYQPHKLSSGEGELLLKRLAPDVMITAAYGQILSEAVLAIPRYGCINVHASLLPKYRGAAPIQWAIINGEKKTGITTMYTVKALDAGDILEQDAADIPPDMTGGELYDALRTLGAKTLLRTLVKLEKGTLTRKPQDETKATYFPMFKKGFGEINFADTCKNIVNLVRGINPEPGAYVIYKGEKVRVYKVSRADAEYGVPAGTTIHSGERNGLHIACLDGTLSIDVIKRQGGKMMDAKESLRGRPIDLGYRFIAAEERV